MSGMRDHKTMAIVFCHSQKFRSMKGMLHTTQSKSIVSAATSIFFLKESDQVAYICVLLILLYVNSKFYANTGRNKCALGWGKILENQ